MTTEIQNLSQSMLLLLPDIFLGISTIILVLCKPVIDNIYIQTSYRSYYSNQKAVLGKVNHVAIHIACAILFTTLILTILVYYIYWILAVNLESVALYKVDTISLMTKLVILVSSFLIVIIGLPFLDERGISSFNVLIIKLFSVLGLMLLVSCDDLLSLYISIELVSLSFYVMASSDKTSEYSTEAGFKYFVLGVFASGFLLLGCSFLYGATGYTNISLIASTLSTLPLNSYDLIIEHGNILLALTLILCALLFKIGAVPFHVWVPDVYQGSPLAITAFFTIVPKIGLITVIVRLFHTKLYIVAWAALIIICASSAVSLVYSSIAAISQSVITRLFAYSSISHTGYILLGLGSGSLTGINSCYIYTIVYIIMSINLFTTLLSLGNGYFTIKYIDELKALYREYPFRSLNIAISLFSMAGIPPLAGFFSKLYIFYSIVEQQMYVLAFLAVLSSVLACSYYLYVIRVIYFNRTPDEWGIHSRIHIRTIVLLGVTIIPIVFFVEYLTPLFNLCLIASRYVDLNSIL